MQISSLYDYVLVIVSDRGLRTFLNPGKYPNVATSFTSDQSVTKD